MNGRRGSDEGSPGVSKSMVEFINLNGNRKSGSGGGDGDGCAIEHFLGLAGAD